MFRSPGRCLRQALITFNPSSFRASSTAAPSGHTRASAPPQPQPIIPADISPEDAQLPRTAPRSTGGGQQIKTHYARLKKPSRAPLVRNFFAGEVDTEFLTYPEVINREDMVELDKDVGRVADYWSERVDSAGIRAAGNIPGSVVKDLQSFRQFGVDVPAEFGGRNYGQTETTRLNEAEAQDISVAVTLNAHRQVIRIIEECGTDEQKQNYLPRLASGELIGTVGFYEAESCSTGIFTTRGKKTDDTWLLSGRKSCVINAPNANLFLVFAQTLSADRLGDLHDSVTAFLVERSASGVKVAERETTVGTCGVPQASVELDNVVLSKAHVVAGLAGGTEVAQKLLRHSRLQTGVVGLELMKQIINQLTQYCIHTTQFGVKLSEVEMLKDKLSRAFSSVYALESMIYLTAGIMDGYEAADVDLETAIIRIFAQQNLLSLGTFALNFMGPKALVSGHPNELQLRDALQIYTAGESVDSLLMLVGLSGIQHAGASLHEVVKKVRNPLMNPSFIFKRLFETQNIENPKGSLNLNHHLHPSLDPAAQWLEHSILRLQNSTETLLSRYGMDSLDKQVELQRLSESAVLIFAAFAAIGRASRSYCIGLQYADFELITANSFAFDAMKAVKQRALEVRDGPYLTNDGNRQKIAGQLFKAGGYFAEHPLKRNL